MSETITARSLLKMLAEEFKKDFSAWRYGVPDQKDQDLNKIICEMADLLSYLLKKDGLLQEDMII